MRRLLLAIALSASVGLQAQTPRPIESGTVLTVDVTAGETVLIDITDHLFDYGGYDGMRLDVRSPSDEAQYASPVYVFNEDYGRTVFRIPDAEPGRWTVTVTGERSQIEGALWATATPPALTLHEAAAAGDLDALRAALSSGDLERFDLAYQTPLMLAASHGHSQAVRLLLDAGADIHAVSGIPEEASEINPEIEPEMSLATALHAAAGSGDAETVGVLLEAGADPNARVLSGATALHAANRATIVRLLLDAGTDPGVVDDYSGTAADGVRGSIESFQRIAARSSDPSAYDDRRADLAAMLALLE